MDANEFKYSKEQYEGRETLDLIRELIRLNHEMKRIEKGTRGVDYWGGYDDSIANDQSSVEFEICRRAMIEFDKVALDSVMANPGVTPVNSHYYAYILHCIMAKALEKLDSGENEVAKEILRSAAIEYGDKEKTEDGQS